VWIWGDVAIGLVKDSSVEWDGSSNVPRRGVCSVRRLTNFINVFLFGVDRSKSARNQELSSRGALNSRLASVDSGLQLTLEIALNGASAKVKPPNRLFGPAESALRRRMTKSKTILSAFPTAVYWTLVQRV
jgi:hypothetical protein